MNNISAEAPPAGVRDIRCWHCGLHIKMARLHPAARRERGRKSKVVMLEAEPRPGRGSVVIGADGVAVFSRQFAGDWVTHRCKTRISACKDCGAEVRVLHAPPGAPEQLVLLEAAASPGGMFVIDPNGWAVPDPSFVLGGARYSRHVHERPGGGGIASIMTEIPRGAR